MATLLQASDLIITADMAESPIFDTNDNIQEVIKSTDMFFGICEDQQLGNYSENGRTFIPLKPKSYMKELKQQLTKYTKDFTERPFKRYAYITSRVKRGPVRDLDEYLMILDCDSFDEMMEATSCLDKGEIKYFCVNSSPARYWVICDKIGTVSDLTSIMYAIPGVDYNYTYCASLQGVLLYRGFPKPGFIPKIGDISKLKGSPLFKRWISRFKEYWESKEVEELAQILFVEAL